jgi:hypothetical protein
MICESSAPSVRIDQIPGDERDLLLAAIVPALDIHRKWAPANRVLWACPIYGCVPEIHKWRDSREAFAISSMYQP